jgi:hypothetical protein
VDLRHLPVGTHSLAPKPGPLVRLAFQKWSAWQELHLLAVRQDPGLSGTPLLIGLHAGAAHGHQCPRSDLHRHFARFKCAVSALDYVGQIGAA